MTDEGPIAYKRLEESFINVPPVPLVMVTRIGTSRTKTRSIYTKHVRSKGKISLSKYFAVFKTGDRVGLTAEPAVTAGMYHPRFYGHTATVTGKQGRCYLVSFNDGGKSKTLIVHPVHLTRIT